MVSLAGCIPKIARTINMKSLHLLGPLVVITAWVFSPLPAEAQVMLSLDTSKTSAPISKYVYGQFAEHLGRSIYGGLWAEMIEDRKFGHGITDEYKPFNLADDNYGKPSAFVYLENSPWKVIGPEAQSRWTRPRPMLAIGRQQYISGGTARSLESRRAMSRTTALVDFWRSRRARRTSDISCWLATPKSGLLRFGWEIPALQRASHLVERAGDWQGVRRMDVVSA